jgi:hypothetical protein
MSLFLYVFGVSIEIVAGPQPSAVAQLGKKANQRRPAEFPPFPCRKEKELRRPRTDFFFFGFPMFTGQRTFQTDDK